MKLIVRLISHQIILHSHSSRNPLESKVKSYCKNTHNEAANKTHLFEQGNALLVKASPISKTSKVSHIFSASHDASTSQLLLMDVHVLLNDCGLSGNVAHANVGKFRPSPHTFEPPVNVGSQITLLD